MPENLAFRIGVFVRLAELTVGRMGRTSLMKLCYFLQTLRGVSLEYDFSLYSYGPFDSEVLWDLQAAENMSVLTSTVIYHSGGYGYEIKPGEESDAAKELVGDELRACEADIKWVAEKFGGRTASDLELLSTILFVSEGGTVGTEDMVRNVKLIKPRFSETQIERQIEWLERNNLI